MAKKKKQSGEMPQTEQRRYDVHPGTDTCYTNAIPRDMSYDLVPESSRTRLFVPDQQTFRVVKKGNCP